MAQKRQIKGLDLIFDENTIESRDKVTRIELSAITPKKNQTRKYFDPAALDGLAQSIATHGVIQPIIVRDIKNGTYEIIAGERRWRASRQAGLSEIPCIIIDADEVLAAQLALIENIQRENLNPYEEAKAYRSLMDDFGLSQEEVSKKVGKSRPAIANSLRLLDLPDSVAEKLKTGIISAGHARALLGLYDKALIDSLTEKIIAKNLSVRATESLVRKTNEAAAKDNASDGEDTVKVNYYEELERRATDLMSRKIKICSAKNKQMIQIEYTDDRDLEELLIKLCGNKIIEE